MTKNFENVARVRVWLARGLNAAAVDPDNPRSVTLAIFLQSDVQASESCTRQNLEGLAAVLSGELESEGGTGNAFTVTISREDVFIENAVSDEFPSFHYTHDEFRTALEQVMTLLAESRKDSSSSQGG